MVKAPEAQQLTPNLWLWQAFDPAVKTDLFSTAALSGNALFLIDPIQLALAPLEKLLDGRQAGGVLVSNANHVRGSAELARACKVPIYGAPEMVGEFEGVEVVRLNSGMKIVPGVTAIAIEGAALGEFAFHFADDGGTMLMGDALIHLDPYGFGLLPAKYCQNHKELRRSLRQLLDWSFERLLFAHGTPLLTQPHERLETLLR
jgi:hypothetical protein